jgi:hypothetical protein
VRNNLSKLVSKADGYIDHLTEAIIKIFSLKKEKTKTVDQKFSQLIDRLPLKTLVTIFFAFLAIVSVILFLNRKPHQAQASWWDETWLYRKAIEVSNSSTAVSNQYIKMTMDTATLISENKMESDCKDIRVTNYNGEVLTYFIDGDDNYDCNDSDTAIYAIVDSIPEDGATIYVYMVTHQLGQLNQN